MIRKTSLVISLILFVLFTGSSFKPSEESAYDICLSTFEKTKTIQTLSYTMNKEERVGNKIQRQTTLTKMQRTPLKVYLKQKKPNDGLEVLYVSGQNGGKAIINPNGFPWMNLNMDPMGSTMRKDQHHTLHDSGFDLVVSILEHLFNKYGDETRELVKLKETVVFDGRECWVIELKNPYYSIVDYTVGASENVVTIANKFKLSEFSILEMNESVDNYDDVTPGQVIRIPNDYAPKMTLYIDKDRQVPLLMKVWDQKGMYENYEYRNVVINPSYTEDVFSKDNENYGF